MDKINLIWLVKSEYEVHFSFDWIQSIFSYFQIENYYDISNNFDIFLDNSILIVCVDKNANPTLINYINKYNSMNLKYTILHLSDEAFEQNIDFYSVSSKIIRNYHKKEYSDKYKLLTIPLGYQSGIKKTETGKTLDINFIGQLKSDRYEMLAKFNNIQSRFIHLTQMWGDPNGIKVEQFSDILSKSWFTLCPRGWISLDSFRINEALECGSIPISILDTDCSDYFEKIYGKHPFIIGNNWEDSFKKYSLCNREDLHNQCSSWWTEYKESLRFKLKDFIKN